MCHINLYSTSVFVAQHTALTWFITQTKKRCSPPLAWYLLQRYHSRYSFLHSLEIPPYYHISIKAHLFLLRHLPKPTLQFCLVNWRGSTKSETIRASPSASLADAQEPEGDTEWALARQLCVGGSRQCKPRGGCRVTESWGFWWMSPME